MASAFARVGDGTVNQQRPKKRGKPRLVVVHGGRELEREEGAALCLEVSRRILARHERSRMASRLERIDKLPPERRGLEAAMLSVEEAFVKALWILQRTEGGEGAIGLVTCGLSYTADELDRYSEALANGGWQTPAPRPAIPSSKEITWAEETQLWVRMLEPAEARVLTLGAMSKCGDPGRRINWIRIRPRLPEFRECTARWLRYKYTDALRSIATQLTLRRIAK